MSAREPRRGSDAPEGDPGGRRGGSPGRRSRLERAEWFFTFLVFFAGFFYLAREARTDLQWYFRVVSIFVGVLGWMVVQVLKWRRR